METTKEEQMFYNHFYDLNFEHNHQIFFSLNIQGMLITYPGVIIEKESSINLILFLENKKYAQYCFGIISLINKNPIILQELEIKSINVDYTYDFSKTTILGNEELNTLNLGLFSIQVFTIDCFSFSLIKSSQNTIGRLICSRNINFLFRYLSNGEINPDQIDQNKLNINEIFKINNNELNFNLHYYKQIQNNKFIEKTYISFDPKIINNYKLIKDIIETLFSLVLLEKVFIYYIEIIDSDSSKNSVNSNYSYKNVNKNNYDIIFNIKTIITCLKEKTFDIKSFQKLKNNIDSYILSFTVDTKSSFIIRYGIIERMANKMVFDEFRIICDKTSIDNKIEAFIENIALNLMDVKDIQKFKDSKNNLLKSNILKINSKDKISKFLKGKRISIMETHSLNDTDINKIVKTRNEIVHGNRQITHDSELPIYNAILGNILKEILRFDVLNDVFDFFEIKNKYAKNDLKK